MANAGIVRHPLESRRITWVRSGAGQVLSRGGDMRSHRHLTVGAGGLVRLCGKNPQISGSDL
jgi:hypothetical protein